MRKFLKILLITFISILFLCLLAIIGLVVFVKPNSYKPLIITAVEKSTSRHLTLAGDISWEFYPQIGFKINKVTLSNPPNFSQTDPFLVIDSVGISVALWPLLHHQVVIQNVRVDGLNLNLMKNNTANNWTFTSESQAISDSTTPSTKLSASEALSSKESSQPFSLELQELKITHATIRYTSDGKQIVALKDFHADMSHGKDGIILFDSKSGITLKDLNFNFNDWLIGNLNFLLPDFNHIKYMSNVSLTKININGLLDGLDIAKKARVGNTLLDNMTLSLSVNGDSNSLKLNEFNLVFPGVLHFKADANVSSFSKLNYTANIKLEDFSLNTVLSKAGIILPKLLSKQELNHVSYQSNLSGNESSAEINGIVFKLGDASLIGDLRLISFSPLTLSENLAIDKLNVDKFIDAKGYQIPISHISLKGDLDVKSFSGEQQLQVDKITLVGLSLDQLIATINKNLDELNKRLEALNKSINDTSKQIAKASNGSILDKAMAAKDSITTLSNLRDSINGLNLDFVNQMKDNINNAIKTKNPGATTDLGQFDANLILKNKIISPSDFELKGPNANIKGSGSVDLKASSINYAVTSQVTAKNINPLLAQLVFPSSIKGELSSPDVSLDWGSISNQIVAYIANATKKQIEEAQKKQATKPQIPQNIGGNNANNQLINSVGKLFGH